MEGIVPCRAVQLYRMAPWRSHPPLPRSPVCVHLGQLARRFVRLVRIEQVEKAVGANRERGERDGCLVRALKVLDARRDCDGRSSERTSREQDGGSLQDMRLEVGLGR